MNKTHLKQRAIELRKQGCSYPEILSEIPIVKSTLWMWLRGIELPSEAIAKFRERKARNRVIGTGAWHEARVRKTDEIYVRSLRDIDDLSLREIWLIGVALYWAEGAKEKDYRPGSSVTFYNSDPKMIYFFHQWLRKICRIKEEDIVYELTIHFASRDRAEEMLNFWVDLLDCPKEVVRVHYKRRQGGDTNRRKTGKDYKGMFKLRARRSSSLTRQIAGWTQAIAKI